MGRLFKLPHEAKRGAQENVRIKQKDIKFYL
jgi:hypothetical protein